MAQPTFVPPEPADQVRAELRPESTGGWRADRPAEIVDSGQPRGDRFGSPGPDQGYALKLAKTFEDDLKLSEGESFENVVAGCLGVATKRASLFGRAPVIYDLEFAFTIWGFLGGAPSDLVKFRYNWFAQASHHYTERREISDMISEEVLRLKPSDVRARLHDWTSLIDAKLGVKVNKRAEALKALSDVSGSES